jgi:hypothetical protein
MTMRPARPVSAEVPFRPAQPPWWPSPGPSPVAPVPPAPVYSPVRWSNPYGQPGSHDARAHRVLTAAEAERYGLLTGRIKRR